jgi:hypothetical protein
MDKKTEEKIDAVKIGNLAAGGKFRLDEIPLRKFYDQAQYIEKILLPKIAESRGESHDDYKFFCDVYRSLLYAVMIVERGNNLILKMQHVNQFNALLQARADLAERELMKYTTMEDLLMTDGLDRIAYETKRRVENLLTNK